MNKELVKSIIKYKLNLANKVINHLPEKISEDAKDIREIIVECIYEDINENKKSPKAKSSEMNNVTIE